MIQRWTSPLIWRRIQHSPAARRKGCVYMYLLVSTCACNSVVHACVFELYGLLCAYMCATYSIRTHASLWLGLWVCVYACSNLQSCVFSPLFLSSTLAPSLPHLSPCFTILIHLVPPSLFLSLPLLSLSLSLSLYSCMALSLPLSLSHSSS